MKSTAIIAIALLVALGIWYVSMQTKTATPVTQVEVETKQPFVADKTFEIKGLNFSYDVKEIKIKLNDKVKINFTNTEGMHDFKIDEFGVATPITKTGETAFVEFVVDKTGTFEYYCSVGQHRANGMWGKLIVE